MKRGQTMTNTEWIWLAIAVIGFLGELVTTQLVLIWFAIGAVLSLMFAVFHLPLYVQIGSFILIGVALSIIFHPIAKKVYSKVKYTPITTNEKVIGQIGKVNNGYITIDGQRWKIANGDDFKDGDQVKVKSISGIDLNVEKAEG